TEAVVNYLKTRYTPPLNLAENYVLENYCPLVLNIPGFIHYAWSDGSEADSIVISESGEYSVTATSTFNEINTDTFTVTFPGSFISPFTLCSNRDSLYTPNLESFDVTWQDGSTDPNYLITQGGEYWLTVTDSEGCSYS